VPAEAVLTCFDRARVEKHFHQRKATAFRRAR
jgi:hypothetical protein